MAHLEMVNVFDRNTAGENRTLDLSAKCGSLLKFSNVTQLGLVFIYN